MVAKNQTLSIPINQHTIVETPILTRLIDPRMQVDLIFMNFGYRQA